MCIGSHIHDSRTIYRYGVSYIEIASAMNMVYAIICISTDTSTKNVVSNM